MAIAATEKIHRGRVKESLTSSLTRMTSYQGKYPKEFEAFLKQPEVIRSLKILSSYLN